jgi:Flp pilus assembly pilin Flp
VTVGPAARSSFFRVRADTAAVSPFRHLRTAPDRRPRGAALVEYAVLIGLIALVAMVALSALGEGARTSFGSSVDALDGVVVDTTVAPPPTTVAPPPTTTAPPPTTSPPTTVKKTCCDDDDD